MDNRVIAPFPGLKPSDFHWISAEPLREPLSWSIFRWILAYVFLANLPIWACQHLFLTPPRAVFNVDYVFVGVLGLYVSPVLYDAVFTVVFLIDFLANATSIYYFSQQDLVNAAKYVNQFPWKRTTLIAATLAVCGFGLAVLCKELRGAVSQNAED
jgi:hypothetical protein